MKFVQGGEVVDEKTIPKLSSGQCVDITVDLRQTENLNGLKNPGVHRERW
ncbi:MAG: hypothetical protein LBP35_02865 [Candidatus Ancillula trichonymphae]|nr:hypothetical protein [Candidatus Ancillula trichonymphae]